MNSPPRPPIVGTSARLFATLSRKHWLVLVMAMLLIAPLSLYVHDFMFETLKVPYPKLVGLPAPFKYLVEAVRLVAVAVFCRLATPRLSNLSAGKSATLVGLLIVMLHETLRVALIETAVVGDGLYALIDRGPQALSLLVSSVASAWIAFTTSRWRVAAISACLIAALATFVVHPALDGLAGSLKSEFAEIAPLYSDPYPNWINVIIYATFLEPTIATFGMIAICWPSLSGGRMRRIWTFAALLLLLRGRITGMLVEVFWVAQPLPMAFLAESQFFLETLVLGVLVALAWTHVCHNSAAASP